MKTRAVKIESAIYSNAPSKLQTMYERLRLLPKLILQNSVTDPSNAKKLEKEYICLVSRV